QAPSCRFPALPRRAGPAPARRGDHAPTHRTCPVPRPCLRGRNSGWAPCKAMIPVLLDPDNSSVIDFQKLKKFTENSVSDTIRWQSREDTGLSPFCHFPFISRSARVTGSCHPDAPGLGEEITQNAAGAPLCQVPVRSPALL